MITPQQLHSILDAIDKANQEDPNLETALYNGITAEYPKETIYSLRMSECLDNFLPNASPELIIAARAQHIERWKSPRTDYPEGRTGYKKWRANLNLFHANQTANIMQQYDCEEKNINRVKFLIQKRQLRKDNETQTLEDVICLVFLKYYFEPFAKKHSEEKIIDILQKTWKKMSKKGHQTALKIDFPESLLVIIKKAL